ncbi:hypothetical protein Cni_G08055 [Canna indica]|uniref:Uncharacterized protein n=1 Tax=Canna indica TaxID=4628 RepID=A0AAQ3K1G6_9LILI|nr:hypothetical protein Cni_G08055 [Canna indica]
MQLWQQHLMFKQLQEIQRQQQLQQLDQGARQLNGPSQLSAVTKPATGIHSPAPMNDVPMNNVYNYSRPNNFVGTPNLLTNSQMFTAGNMNWLPSNCSPSMHNLANGVLIPNDQNEAMRSMGFLSQQINQTFHGIPVSDTSCINQYPHVLGSANNQHDLMTKADATKAEKAYPSRNFQCDEQLAAQGCLQDENLATAQNSQSKQYFGNSQVHVSGNNAVSGNFQEVNNLQSSVQFQESHGRYERDDSSGNSRGKAASQVGTSLDPIEQKILFGTDDDNWGFSFGGSLISGTGGDMHGHLSDNDYSGAYPSLHSGSWSALMQEAVQSSCSDKGLQEEWSSSSFQKSEQLNVNPPVLTNANGKHPATWDNRNLHSASSLTSTPFPLFSDDNATPRSSSAPNNQHPFKSTHEEDNNILTKAPHVSSPFQGASDNEFHGSRSQSQLREDGLQAQMPSTSELWPSQAIGQQDKSSEDIQFRQSNMEGGRDNQPNSPFANISMQSANKLNGWNANYPMEFRGSNTSNYHGNNGNVWKIGEEHVNLNSGLQPVQPYIGNPKMQDDGSLAGRHTAIDACVNSEGDQDVERKQNQPSRRPQSWEPSADTTVEKLGHDRENGTFHKKVVTNEGYLGNTSKDKMLLTGNDSDQYPPKSGSQNLPFQSGQQSVGSKGLHNSLGNSRTAGLSFPPNYSLRLHDMPDSVFHELNNEEQKFVRRTQFAGHIVSSEPMIASKGTAVRAEEVQFRKNMPIYASNNPLDGSTTQYSHNEMIPQESNNMLELLHKVDQSTDGNSVNPSDLSTQTVTDVSVTHPQLRLAPPSQRQSLSNYAPISSKSVSDINSRQLDHEAGYRDQPQSRGASSAQVVSPLDEASKIENQDKISSLSGQKNKEHPDANKHFMFSSVSASNFSIAGKQLQEQQQQQQLLQQHISSAKDYLLQQQQQRQQQHLSDMIAHEALDQSAKFSFSKQANEGVPDKNASLSKQPPDSHSEATPGQSVQRSLPTLGGGFPTSGVDSFGATPGPACLQVSSGGTDDREPTTARFSHITRSAQAQQLPVMETNSAIPSSISGMSQQVAFSNMLHNVWTNISARQRQSGINPQMLTPNILQSIINNGRGKSLWGLPKTGEQVNKDGSATPEVGSSSVNSHREDNSVQGKSSNLADSKVDATCRSMSACQAEAGFKPPFDGSYSAPVSSLVRLHQQDVNKAKFGLGPAFSSPASHSPLTNMLPSSNDVEISRCMSKQSDVQQQNYSLLHQVQAMKTSDSDVNTITCKLPNEVGSHATQMSYNRDQRFDNHRDTVFRIPDGKVGVASQSSTSDAKMLTFASNAGEERNPTTSRFGQHDLQTNTHLLSTGSTGKVMGGSERTQISPQMAPSWFERYGSYQNDRMVAVYDAQRNEKTPIQQYFSQKIPARMDNNNLEEQRLDSGQIGSFRPGTLAPKKAPNELSSLLPPGISDHDMIIRSKRRKIMRDLPWHKIVSGPQTQLCISVAELDWAQAANRLIEKVDDEDETMEDVPLVPQSRRRLILTTQLMHQVLPAIPAVMFKGEAISNHESVTFSVAKLALADACSLVSPPESDSLVQLRNENISQKISTSKVEDDLSKLVEDFVGRSNKLEMDFSRLDKKNSILDVRLECQELERFSIVNRLGKFHGRTHADGIEASSDPQNAHPRIFLQRYINALPMPGNLPEGVLCLSL